MRRGFTLIEMLVVLTIAMIIMGMAAAGYRNVKKGQLLIGGAMTVESTLQSARTKAMQLGKVVRVYFLDGGEPLNSTTSKPVNYDGTTPSNYLLAFTTYDVPYELRVMTKDGEELARNLMPEAIGWMSLGNGARGFMNSDATTDTNLSDDFDWDETTHKNSFTVPNENIAAFHRNCSLIINFSPAGNAWADAAPSRMNGTNYRDSVTNIRVFNIDDIDTSSSKLVAQEDSTATGFYSDAVNTPNYAIVAKTFWKDTGNNSDKDSLTDDQKTWFTIKWNAATGMAELVNGQKE